MIDAALAGSAPFLPVRLVVFPEFAHAAPVFAAVEELLEKLAIPIPNEHTERLAAKAREHGIYIQTGTMLEADSQWPEVVFNTTCLLGPEGIFYKYRKLLDGREQVPGAREHCFGQTRRASIRNSGHDVLRRSGDAFHPV